MMVGRLLSFWEGLSSGAMLNFWSARNFLHLQTPFLSDKCFSQWDCGGFWSSHPFYSEKNHTLPKTKIAPENKLLKIEIPIGNHHFQVQTVSFREYPYSCELSRKPFPKRSLIQSMMFLDSISVKK